MAQVADIAEQNVISKKFLDAILTDLRRAGLVYSKKGKGGGYTLARPAREISVGTIVRAIDGPLAPIACASVTAYRPCEDCVDLKTCQVRIMMIAARNAIANALDNTSLAEMRAFGDVGTRDPDLQHLRRESGGASKRQRNFKARKACFFPCRTPSLSSTGRT